MMTNNIAARKWKKFLHRAQLFRYIPFIEFVLGAGSMALGNPHKNSDFDVIIGVKSGRIFTARFFAVLMFGLFGWRRKATHNKEADPKSVSDKICLSHFVTEKSYRLSLPHDEYRHRLYKLLVPLWGDKDKIQKFFDANDWLDSPISRKSDEKYNSQSSSFFKRLKEFILSGKLGDWLEKILKAIQVKRIERGLGGLKNARPMIIYTDELLEFHPKIRQEAV